MIALDQLKNLVLNKVQKDGYLDHVRAQLKLQVYKIIENEGQGLKEKAGFQWEHPQLQMLQGLQYGNLCLKLIYEFLEFFKLEYTLEVFKKEVSIKERIYKSDLEQELIFRKTPDSSKALLLNIVSEYIDITQTGCLPINSPKKDLNYDSFTAATTTQKNKPQTTNNPKQKTSQEIKEELDRIEREETERKKKDDEEKARKLKEQKEKEQKEKEEKEQQEKKKNKKRPETAPVKEEKPPATAVNKIRGGPSTSNTNKIVNMYNIPSNTTNAGQPDKFSQTMKKDPYSFNIGGGGAGTSSMYSMQKDPYAFDIEGDIQPTTSKKASQDPYAFDITQAFDQGKNNKKFAGSSGYDKFGKNNQGNDYDEYLQEEIEDFQDSDVYTTTNNKNKKEQKNQMFTSSEDFVGVSQSQGYDQSADSDAMDNYDYFEPINKKNR